LIDGLATAILDEPLGEKVRVGRLARTRRFLK
jgi:hypothetical protein